MKLSYLLEKTHLFKRRHKASLQTIHSVLIGDLGVVFLSRFRFELTYLRIIHRILRRRFIRRKYLFKKLYYWVLVTPNHIVSAHSKNIRMGGGVGLALRVCIDVRPGHRLLETQGFSYLWLRQAVHYWRYKWYSPLLIIS